MRVEEYKICALLVYGKTRRAEEYKMCAVLVYGKTRRAEEYKTCAVLVYEGTRRAEEYKICAVLVYEDTRRAEEYKICDLLVYLASSLKPIHTLWDTQANDDRSARFNRPLKKPSCLYTLYVGSWIWSEVVTEVGYSLFVFLVPGYFLTQGDLVLG